jgi:hypothetical protein
MSTPTEPTFVEYLASQVVGPRGRFYTEAQIADLIRRTVVQTMEEEGCRQRRQQIQIRIWELEHEAAQLRRLAWQYRRNGYLDSLYPQTKVKSEVWHTVAEELESHVKLLEQRKKKLAEELSE